MIRSYSLLLFFALLPLSTFAQVEETARAERALAPNLVALSDGRIVRLLGIDAPADGSVSAADCRSHLQELVGGKDLRLLADSTFADDGSDTIVRYLYLDSILVNSRMIADGYAVDLPINHAKRDEFRSVSAGRIQNAGTRAAGSPDHTSGTTESSSSTSVQCSATTKKGSRCKRMTTNSSGLCWQHE